MNLEGKNIVIREAEAQDMEALKTWTAPTITAIG